MQVVLEMLSYPLRRGYGAEDLGGFVPHSTSNTRLYPKFPELRTERNFESRGF